MRKTEWFPANVKPVHVGVYETRDELDVHWFNWWSGTHWGWGVTPDGVLRGGWPKASSGNARCQRRPWRGQTEQSK